ncbi:hypothetical protein [Paenibacillus graminis]|uniref:hypothetical protein n=1 Tax=Paenibacillus graminis TaxID=189425 RepID=UPI002DBE1205|nr:hypothetical protein [Paenibacillus graminis]MEC0167375.1 hypothetical protein [Paenibacillus graminis]
MKTYKDWTGSLSTYLQIGDLVDEAMADHFVEVMPPITFDGQLIQMGEPHHHVGERATYPTLERSPKGWVYRGNCFQGETLARY